MKLNKFSKSVFSAKSTFFCKIAIGANKSYIAKEAIELVCGCSTKCCVLIERTAQHRVKSEQWQLKPGLISCLYITSVLSWMKSMETICSSHNSLNRDLSLYKDQKIRNAAAGEPTLLELFLKFGCLLGRGGDNRAVTELGFTHVTTKTWAYLGMFGFFRNFFGHKFSPPPAKSHFENTMGNSFFDFFKY